MIANTKMHLKLFEIRNHYEELQKYGYLKDGISPGNEMQSVRDLKAKLPSYVDPYLEKNRAQILERQKKHQEELEEVKQNEKKYKRYHQFKTEFRDVFEEHDQITNCDKK